MDEPDMDEHTYAHSRAWDRLCALPLIAFNGLAALGFAITAAKMAHHRIDLAGGLQILSAVGSFIFFSQEAILVCIRRLPVRKLSGIWPRASAVLAAYAPFALILLPHRPFALQESLASVLLLMTGTAGSIVTLAFLGRSFAILPAARRLVTGGPYRYVRHPLYLFGALSLLGVSLQFAQPWALMIAAGGCLIQFPRMFYEEQVLKAAFPQYAVYRARTALIVPGLL